MEDTKDYQNDFVADKVATTHDVGKNKKAHLMEQILPKLEAEYEAGKPLDKGMHYEIIYSNCPVTGVPSRVRLINELHQRCEMEKDNTTRIESYDIGADRTRLEEERRELKAKFQSHVAGESAKVAVLEAALRDRNEHIRHLQAQLRRATEMGGTGNRFGYGNLCSQDNTAVEGQEKGKEMGKGVGGKFKKVFGVN